MQVSWRVVRLLDGGVDVDGALAAELPRTLVATSSSCRLTRRAGGRDGLGTDGMMTHVLVGLRGLGGKRERGGGEVLNNVTS